MDPLDLPDGTDSEPKPWDKPQPPPQAGDASSGPVDGSGLGDLAGGAVDAVGGIADAAGTALDGLGGCADGCSGCSLAILALLFAAGSAVAMFR